MKAIMGMLIGISMAMGSAAFAGGSAPTCGVESASRAELMGQVAEARLNGASVTLYEFTGAPVEAAMAIIRDRMGAAAQMYGIPTAVDNILVAYLQDGSVNVAFLFEGCLVRVARNVDRTLVDDVIRLVQADRHAINLPEDNIQATLRMMNAQGGFGATR